MKERRQNVRVRPASDFNVGIDFGAGIVREQLSVLDVAVGGVGLMVSEPLLGLAAGSEIRVGVTLPGGPRFVTTGTVRYTQGRIGGRCGVHLDRLTDEQQTALSKTVSELLERGHFA